MKDEWVYLRHILDEIAFLKNGEAAKNVPDPIKRKSPDIPWHEMAALRDRIIHGYFRIDYSVVWNVIKEDLPDAEPKISALLKKLDARTR